jgi:type IV pilus assembly protein PilA
LLPNVYYIKLEKRGASYTMSRSKLQQGFTIMELMVVVAIIGILASVALSAYQDYVNKAKIIEGLSLVASAKTAVAENAANGMPFDSGWVAPLPTHIVSADPTGMSHLASDTGIKINNTNGEITITYTNKIALGSPTLLLIPVDGGKPLVPGQVIADQMIVWQCHSASPPLNNVLRNHKGTLDSEFVPADCRA